MGSAAQLPRAHRLGMVAAMAAAVVISIRTADGAPSTDPVPFAGTVARAKGAGGKEAKDASAAAPPAQPKPAAHVTAADLDDVEHMCALLTGCDRLPLPSGLVARELAGCVKTMYDELASAAAVSFSLTLRECGLRASSCGELRACALRGARSDVCAGRGRQGPVDLCDEGGRAVTCDRDRVTQVRDCPRGGEQCVVRGGHAQCALGSCEKESAPTCSPSSTRILECKQGKLASLDCAAFGLRCTSTADGPRCATQGPTCVETSARCEGNAAVVCRNGHEVRVDCGPNLSCGSSGAAVGACVAPAPSSNGCDPASASRCDGATVRWCAFGKPRSYLCKSVGLSRCVSDERGAHCAG